MKFKISKNALSYILRYADNNPSSIDFEFVDTSDGEIPTEDDAKELARRYNTYSELQDKIEKLKVLINGDT